MVDGKVRSTFLATTLPALLVVVSLDEEAGNRAWHDWLAYHETRICLVMLMLVSCFLCLKAGRGAPGVPQGAGEAAGGLVVNQLSDNVVTYVILCRSRFPLPRVL